ncbi:ShlB/FhaC/HecB family hemolysin secretion/activation protein [Novipirellula sp.]|uniref:ShlB/FhaC/HecB family hemolysin secretion/activation protein n=1 Tax=Novipirellula sp. TaxID=2795430 RepID=UPI003567F61A
MTIRCTASLLLACFILYAQTHESHAQDYERYKPLTIPSQPAQQTIQPDKLPTVEGSDRELIESLDAVLFLDHNDKVQAEEANADLTGIHYDFDSQHSLIYSQGLTQIVDRYLGSPVTLRKLNQLSRDIILYYRRCGQPVVDVIIPEQKITGGTVQLVVIESRIGSVRVEGGCYFNPCDVAEWIECTRRGSRIRESAIANDLFWLNQNPFRKVDVDLRPGTAEGTTDVVFELTDVCPINAYVGYEDTGVRPLMLERLYTGLLWGNAFGRDATLSYQYTADADFSHLHAHAVSYSEAIDRQWSFQTYGSWAQVAPELGIGLSQDGESWQAGLGLTRHLIKNQYQDISGSLGFDFKSTNNNLEFGGVNVQDSNADLAQIRLGLRSVKRMRDRQYSLWSIDTFVGPGGGFTSAANTAAMNTIRTGTSPDYIYARGRMERLWDLPSGWDFVARGVGQITSERLLFSETLGFGGFDSVRGYDQRVFSGDSGWITNFELGPEPWRWGYGEQCHTLRAYGLLDAGGAYIEDPVAGETADEFLISMGAGLRLQLGDRGNLRIDYAHGFEPVDGAVSRDRIHIGFVSLFGPRP